MSESRPILVSTTAELAGQRAARHLGPVFGVDVRYTAPGEISDVDATSEGAEHVADAMGQMIEHAQRLGADAVVGLRLVSTGLGEGMVELIAYGTAVALSEA